MKNNLSRTIIHKNFSCNNCKKEIKNAKVVWIFGERDENKIIKNVGEAFYYCLPCGNQIYKQISSQQVQEKCSLPSCGNLLSTKSNRFVCKDLEESFCSLDCFEKVCGVFCSCCGNKQNAKLDDYLQIIHAPTSPFQKIFPFALGGLVIFIVIVMTISIKKQEKKWLNK